MKNILFIDDQDKNFKEANNLGWNKLLSDEKGDWIKKVMPLFCEQNNNINIAYKISDPKDSDG